MKCIKVDCRVLQSVNVYDYKLLLVIYRHHLVAKEEEDRNQNISVLTKEGEKKMKLLLEFPIGQLQCKNCNVATAFYIADSAQKSRNYIDQY